MTTRFCTCGRTMAANREKCLRCRKGEPRVVTPAPERNLNACTACGYQAANRGLLAIHVRAKHAPVEE